MVKLRVRNTAIHSRVAQSCTCIFVWFHIQTGPSSLFTKPPAFREEFLIRVAGTTGVVADNDWNPEGIALAFDKMSILVVYEDQLRARVFEDIGDFLDGETVIDWRDNGSGSEDALVCIRNQGA